MKSATILPTPAIECGLRGLSGVAACEVEGGPEFDQKSKRWVVRLTLRRSTCTEFVGISTQWCLLLDTNYPFGRVSFFPAAEGGLTVTFPHQSRNTPNREGFEWRNGKLCLDLPFGCERRAEREREPVGDAEQRLRWNAERAIQWLNRAAENQLRADGDPFEVPERPYTTDRAWGRVRVVHDESTATLSVWNGRAKGFGLVKFGVVTEIANVIAVSAFEDQDGCPFRMWSGRELGKLGEQWHLHGFWWLWPQPVVARPWHAPGTWGELRQIADEMGVDSDGILQWLFPILRGTRTNGILMVGYPVPTYIGAAASEVHWDALLLPRLEKAEGQPNGFRPNARGWWHRDRYGKLGDNVPLEYLFVDNWNCDRLQARGRLPTGMRDKHVALLGVGALGSILAEMLVRAGVKSIALFDADVLTAGNICRHTATLVDVGKGKVVTVAQRLRQISPSVRVEEVNEMLCGDAKSIEDRFDQYDLIIDCTSSDTALAMLATAWWPIPRTFASFSMGFGGKRLFSFGLSSNRFPKDEFMREVQPWLEFEANDWANNKEVIEGAGCWSPLFPARYDDVVLAAATCVKEIEMLLANVPFQHRFRVFEQAASDEGFQGFMNVREPLARKASSP